MTAPLLSFSLWLNHRWVSECPSANAKPQLPLWDEPGESYHTGCSIPKHKAASLRLWTSSSTSTQSMDCPGAPVSVALPKVRQGEFRRCVSWLFSHGPLTDRFGIPLWGLPGPGPAASKPGSMVPTALFIEKVLAAGTILPINDGSVP